nr:uncharacterized mitochondrial protein AtMg00810-like [Tanacetum cinerariifolium]
MVEKSKLDEDKEGKAVDLSHYRGMIGTLYLTSSRPDLQLAICMCARYQARPTEKHLHAVKRIFRYLRGTVNRGLWYTKDSSIALTEFTDADHAGCQDICRSTSVQDDSTCSPSSTTVDQDAPSASKSHTTIEIQSIVIPQEVEEENLDIEVAHIGNDPSGLVPKPTSSTSFAPLSRNNWDLLFQPLFEELLTPPPSVDPSAPKVITPIDEVVAPKLAELTGPPFSTTVDQDAPSPSKSQTTPKTQPPVIPHDIKEDNKDIEVAHMGNDQLFGMPIPEVASDQSSSMDSIHTVVHLDH